MTVIQKTIGRLPVNLGDYDSTRAYGKKNRVLLYGCEWESKVNNNTYAPAALNTTTGVIAPDTTHWKLISGSYNTWLIDNGYQKLDASNVKDGNHTQHEINEAIAGEIGDDESANTIKGRITTLEGEVGTGGSVDERIAAEGDRHYLKSETYTKSEVNGMITTPDQEYKTVTATDQTTAVTDVLPATGEPDTVYRVGNWDGNQYDATAYSEYAWNESTSQYIHLSTKTQIGEVFDISAYHATGGTLATYFDLNDALNGVNGGVPQSLQKGGMSVKFVQSSDNKYVRYNLLADSFTTDTTQWAIDDAGVYVDNPEFVEVHTDSQNRILWAIKADCTIYYGAGVPPQVVDYIQQKIDELSLNEYEDIVSFLNGLEEGDKTLQQLLNGKVDKITGKGLSTNDYDNAAKSIVDMNEEIDNPEFIEVKTDSQNRILEGIKPNGTKHIEGDLEVKGNIINPGIQGQIDEAIEDVQEEVEQMLDSAQETLSYFEPVENPEFSEVTVDSGNKIVSERDNDGVLHENVGIETPLANIEQVNTNKLNLTEKGIYDLNKDTDKVFTTVEEAVAKKVDGIIRVGENVVVGLKTLDSPYSAADIEANYKNTLPAPKFPFVKQASIHRLYDDAATPNMLYICSHSDNHIFYSICPTDLKRAVYEEGYYTKYNANYFYYADKQTPSDIHKVVLPATVGGVSMNHRIKYIHEMSNGDCLLEIENGDIIPGWGEGRHNNIYKVKKVFSGETIQESDVTLSISLDFYAEKISSFDNIVEYKAGHIVMAPYWGGRTAKVWITKDYGDTWDLIFCADPNNTHYIKPKAEHYGEQDAYGIYPPTELLNPEGQIDWSTPSNGNVHVHGIAYDRWYDRIWIVTGDGDWNTPHDVTGIWWTDDEGYTWKRIGGINDIKTQLIGIIPMDHCVLFPTDGFGDGFWRWSRNGKDEIIKIENCYNYLGYYDALKVVGQRSIKTKNDFYLCVFAPNQYNESYEDYPGGIVASPNGFDFEIIYKDEYFQGSDDTVEIGWGCDITDCEDKLILSAAQGGYLELKY